MDLLFGGLIEPEEVLSFLSNSLGINIVVYCVEEPNIDSSLDQFCNLCIVVSPEFCDADLLNLTVASRLFFHGIHGEVCELSNNCINGNYNNQMANCEAFLFGDHLS